MFFVGGCCPFVCYEINSKCDRRILLQFFFFFGIMCIVTIPFHPFCCKFSSLYFSFFPSFIQLGSSEWRGGSRCLVVHWPLVTSSSSSLHETPPILLHCHAATASATTMLFFSFLIPEEMSRIFHSMSLECVFFYILFNVIRKERRIFDQSNIQRSFPSLVIDESTHRETTITSTHR